MKKIKILILIRRFDTKYPKHKHLYDSVIALEEFCEVRYWYEDGDITKILEKIDFSPDFIYYYDTTWDYGLTPKITGFEKVNIPKGWQVHDIYHAKEKRKNFIKNNNIDLIFTYYKEPFLKTYPEYKNKYRWIPFSINTNIIKDWNLQKDIDYLLMGQFYYQDYKNPPKQLPPRGRYKFREAVYNKMQEEEGFLFVPHPGHIASQSKELMVNENYAKQLNKSKIFFTCGSKLEYAVAKYFEALGCRTLLLAKPNKDILELGFQDGVNFVACNEEDFYEKALYYLNNENERKRITDNGYNFVHNYHSNSIRALQFVKYVEAFLKN